MRPEAIDEERSKREPEPLLQIFRLGESREIEIGCELFRCRRHAYLRLTCFGGGMTGISEEAIDFVKENRREDVCWYRRRVPLRGFRSTRPAKGPTA